jgi:hypothetical protein
VGVKHISGIVDFCGQPEFANMINIQKSGQLSMHCILGLAQ